MVADIVHAKIFHPPTPDQLAVIQKELNGCDDKTEHIEKLIKQWIALEPGFPKNLDERYIVHTIKFSKHNLEKTKKKIENYLVTKACYPNFFTNRVPSSADLLRIQDVLSIGHSKKITDQGSRLLYFSVKDNRPELFDPELINKIIFMSLDAILVSEYLFCGEICIVDCKNITPGHITRLFNLFKIMIPILRQAYAIRMKQVHLINVLPVIETVTNSIKPLLHKKIKENTFVHKDFKTLHQHIPLEHLPTNYGGTSTSLEESNKNFKKYLLDMEGWFAQQENIKLSGSYTKNIKIYSSCGNEISMEGSFRKLNID